MGQPVLVLVALIIASVVAKATPTSLTSANFDGAVFDSGKSAFIKFYAPWCSHCQRMAPDWDRLTDKYAGSGSVLVAELDCTR